MNTITRPERSYAILGVDGRLTNAIANGNGLFASQTWEASRTIGKERLVVKIRFDDNCKNGHQTFAITGTLYKQRRGSWSDVVGGCIHDEITRIFPELAPLIRWHLVSTNGPMHYIANAVYLAGDRDHRGMRKGERRQLRKGKSRLPAWQLVRVDGNGNVDTGEKLPQYVDAAERPNGGYRMEYREWWVDGEGKERQLDAARSAAVWPEATDAQLSAEPDALKAMLLERLPALMSDFRDAMATCGLEWREVSTSEESTQ